MSIEKEILKEHKKLSKEMETNQKKLEALEHILREYKIFVYPSSTTITDMIFKCMQKYGGTATFYTITTYLKSEGIDMPKQKIILLLTKNSKFAYNKATDKWEIVTPVNDNSAVHLDHENTTSFSVAS